MAKVTLQIQSVWDGWSPSQYAGFKGGYNSSIAVDPDFPITSSDVRTSGYLVPIAYSDFSGANVTSQVVAIINTPKNTNTYVVLSNGRLISYDSDFANETLIGTVTGSTAKGAAYYNNYIYIFTGTDVSRYGPLNNSPALTNTVWTGATLGSLTALTNTTYPTLRGVSIPNHWAHVHGDNALYFCDFINGQGLIHKIKTTKTTDEGDTNNGSAYNVLDLPFGFYPTDIETYGTDLFILGIQTTDNAINQGKGVFVIWDAIQASFQRGPVPLPDPIATACLNANGLIYLFTGNGQNGVRVSSYIGGDSVKDIAFQEEGLPPFAGAVDTLGNRIVWGGFSTYPAASACVWAFGSKDNRLPDGIHNIVKTASAGANPNVTALKYIQQSSNIQPKVIAAWKDDSDQGIDKYSSSGTLTSVMRWMFPMSQKFNIKKIRIPFAGAVAANTSITPKVYLDDSSTTKTLTAINNTTYPSKRKVLYKAPELKDYIGETNFMFELNWASTNPLAVALPIVIEAETHEDEQ